jgi:hypothetical protein
MIPIHGPRRTKRLAWFNKDQDTSEKEKQKLQDVDAEEEHSKSRSWATPVVIKTNEDDGRQHIGVKDGPEYRAASWQESNSRETIERY